MKLSGIRTALLRPYPLTQAHRYGLRQQSTKVSDPLRILFCGSDAFSIASLRAVYNEHLKDPGLVKSIDVVYRPAKRFGRGLKNVRDGTIARVTTPDLHADHLQFPSKQLRRNLICQFMRSTPSPDGK